jgi:hypothetical protein
MAQTLPMSIGSAFDAHAKAYISERLFGKGAKPEFDFETIFEAQVESHNRDWARKHGEHAFKSYQKSGALSNLMIELGKSQIDPKMEFSAEGIVQGVPLLGKPDLYFVSETGAHIIVDWKVNGYCAKRGKSPAKGYVWCRDGWDAAQYKHSRSHDKRHKDCHPMLIGGLMINIGTFMEDVDASWARQLCIYAWLLGEEIGSNFIIVIDQLACQPGTDDFAKIRVASHRLRASRDFQLGVIKNANEIWTALHSGHIFDEMTREENDKQCRKLDRVYKAYIGTSDKDAWFNKMQNRG